MRFGSLDGAERGRHAGPARRVRRPRRQQRRRQDHPAPCPARPPAAQRHAPRRRRRRLPGDGVPAPVHAPPVGAEQPARRPLAGRRARGRSGPRRALEALQRAGLADRAERPARTLSGGQQQRLALARAWAVRPDVLFLDEPTSNLDPAAKKEIEAMLAAFAADGMTLVMSTHNLGQAKRLATRVILPRRRPGPRRPADRALLRRACGPAAAPSFAHPPDLRGPPMTSSPRSFVRKLLLGLGAAAWALFAAAADGDPFIVMSSTTSTEQSGLFAHLLPAFKKARGIDVRVVAQGTGQALDMGRRGDADVLFVHDQAAEEKFVAEGFGLERRPVMYNDFVLIGPAADPAGTRGKDIVAALKKLAASGSTLRLARRPQRHPRRRAALLEAGRHRRPGRGRRRQDLRLPRLRLRHGPGAQHRRRAATPTCLPTAAPGWRSRTAAELAILVEGDTRLFNQYGVIVVNPARHPHVKMALAQAFADWVVAPRRPGDDRRLQDRRQAAVLPERGALSRDAR